MPGDREETGKGRGCVVDLTGIYRWHVVRVMSTIINEFGLKNSRRCRLLHNSQRLTAANTRASKFGIIPISYKVLRTLEHYCKKYPRS